MTTTALSRTQAIYELDTENLIREHEHEFAYGVLCDLRERLKSCDSEQERRETCILWRDLYKGERR